MSGRAGTPAETLAAVAAALERGLPVRLDLPRRGRLHLDRPLPFLAVHVGQRAAPAARTAAMANAAYLLAPNLSDAAAIVRLVGERMRAEFGAFLVGLDIVGDRILEINVFTPGGLGTLAQLYDTNFSDTVIAALEEKIAIRAAYGGRLENSRLATL